MPLIDLKTDLKSLRYGQDRPGGGDSGQPYIKTNINTVSNGKLIKIDDGLVRGGFLGSQAKSATDTLRISKFLIDTPRGPLFIVKQIGLQLSGPRLESKQLKVNNATSGGGFFNNAINFVTNVVNKIENAVGPTRIYNLGINTLAQVQVNALGGHIVRHGFLPVTDSSKYYESVVTANNQNGTNRLEGLANSFRLGGNVIGNDKRNLRKSDKFNSFIKSASATIATRKITPEDLIIDSYIGGPGSVYGVGSTLIRRALTPIGVPPPSRLNEIVEAGRPLVNGERQDFTYIDKDSGDGVIPSGIGARNNHFSLYNETYSIGGRGYFSGTVDKFGAGSAYNTPEFTPGDIAKATVQSVNTDGYEKPDSNVKIAASITDVNNKLRDTKFYFGASNFSNSSLTDTTFDANGSSSISDNPDNNRQSIDDRTAAFNLPQDKAGLYKTPTTLYYYGTLGLSNQYFSSSEAAYVGINPQTKTKIAPNAFTNTLKEINRVTASITIPGSLTTANVSANKKFIPQYQIYRKIIDNRQFRENIDDGINEFGIYAENVVNSKNLTAYPNGILPSSTNYPKYKNAYGDIVTQKIQWNQASREIRIGSGRTDSVNLTPILDGIPSYDGNDATPNGVHKYRDLVKFKIQAINTDTPDTTSLMVFRAYLTGLSDSVDASWQDIKYAGRGDKFYIYDGFSRKMSVSFKVAALSKKEMQPMYQKLNFLMGNLMPDYKDNLMRGPLVRMTIGNYIDAQLCKLDSVSYTIPQDSPWEIAMDEPEAGTKTLILPHIIEVQLSFTPIGSESNGGNKIQSKDKTTSHIAQNNTGTLYQYIK